MTEPTIAAQIERLHGPATPESLYWQQCDMCDAYGPYRTSYRAAVEAILSLGWEHTPSPHDDGEDMDICPTCLLAASQAKVFEQWHPPSRGKR